MHLKRPWVSIDESLPKPGQLVLWMDVDGGFHLASFIDGSVCPVTYGNSDIVIRALSDHVCWCEPVDSNRPLHSVPSSKPAEGQEVIWIGEDGSLHLGRMTGKMIMMAVYGNATDVIHITSRYDTWQEIQQPELANEIG
jgi:hypothetical protein